MEALQVAPQETSPVGSQPALLVGVGSVVRCISTNGVDPAICLYAIVISVAPPQDDLTGTDGQPALGVVYLDPRPKRDLAAGHPGIDRRYPNRLGTAEWHTEFARASGVLHFSHQDVKEGKVSLFWVDVLRALPDVSQDKLKSYLERGEPITTPEDTPEYPKGDIVTSSGKTQEQLDAEHQQMDAEMDAGLSDPKPEKASKKKSGTEPGTQA